MNYELFYLVGASKEAELDKIKKEVSDIATSEGAVFEDKQVVEKRKMAYEIKRENRGFYVAQRFDLEEPEKIQSMIKKLNLYGNILRSLITRTDELPELTSREERETKDKAKIRIEAPKKEKLSEVKAVESKKEEVPAIPEQKKAEEEDIDKKLEEILNI